MNRISSRSTFFYKRVFPILWFGMSALGFCIGLIMGVQQMQQFPLEILFAVMFFATIIGYVVMKLFVFHLVDEVWINGDSIVVKNAGIEHKFEFSEFVNVSYQGMINPPRVTLLLREVSKVGIEISFIPPFRIFPYSAPPIVSFLIEKIDVARGQ